MNYYEHSILSSRKFNCNMEDTLFLHELMDSSKIHFPGWQHRMFSHNTWFISAVERIYERLTGSTLIKNTRTEDYIPVREVLMEHLLDDHCRIPSVRDWLSCIRFDTEEKWINNPDKEKIRYLRQLNNSPKGEI